MLGLKIIYGIEIYPDLAMATKVNMVGHGDGSANILPNDGLIDFADYPNGKLLNVKKASNVYPKYVNEQFDIVVSNPPFSITVDRETAKQFPKLYIQGEKIQKSLKKENKKIIDTENLFIERWYQLLRPKGRLGVVLPESVFDLSSNKEIRLFIFKYFWVKAVVSLPYLAFAPYTMTKTSLLFAQKKTEKEVEDWNDNWDWYNKEFIKIKNQLDKLKKKKETSSLHDNFVEILKKYLLSIFETEDESLTISQLKDKYEDDIKMVDADWWIFSKMSNKYNYSIFMSHAEEIGYKRGTKKIEDRPNELFSSVCIDDSNYVIINEKPEKILDYFKQSVVWE